MKEKRRLKAEMFKKQKVRLDLVKGQGIFVAYTKMIFILFILQEAKQLKALSKFPEGALEKALSKMANQRAEK